MNKHVIMQKLLNNEDVSDSLFRKIYQFLDVVDSNDVEKLVEIFKEFYPEDSKTEEKNSENSEKTDESNGENDNEISNNRTDNITKDALEIRK